MSASEQVLCVLCHQQVPLKQVRRMGIIYQPAGRKPRHWCGCRMKEAGAGWGKGSSNSTLFLNGRKPRRTKAEIQAAIEAGTYVSRSRKSI